jgi:hypothetical protein
MASFILCMACTQIQEEREGKKRKKFISSQIASIHHTRAIWGERGHQESNDATEAPVQLPEPATYATRSQ